jgi:hypothetical protein
MTTMVPEILEEKKSIKSSYTGYSWTCLMILPDSLKINQRTTKIH